MLHELLSVEYVSVQSDGPGSLEDISINLFRNEILGIYVEGVKEAETLYHLIRGRVFAQRGRVLLQQKPYTQISQQMLDSIVCIEQRSRLIEEFSIADNLFVFRNKFKKIYIQPEKIEQQAGYFLRKIGLICDPATFVKSLPRVKQIEIELAKSLLHRTPFVILYNPTRFLSDEELQQLQGIIQSFREQGLTILIIDTTDFFIRRLVDRYYQIQGGRILWLFRGTDLVGESFISKSLPQIPFPDQHTHFTERQLLMELRYRVNSGTQLFSIAEGGVTAILDTHGSGIDALKKYLEGYDEAHTWELSIHGERQDRLSYHDLRKSGIGLVDERPALDQLFKDMSVLDNLLFILGMRMPVLWRRANYRNHVIKTYGPLFECKDLSQSVNIASPRDRLTLLYYRWLVFRPKLLFLIKPFSSVDKQLADLLIKLIQDLNKNSISLVIFSSNEREIQLISKVFATQIQRLPPSS